MNITYYVRISEYEGTFDESLPEVLTTSYTDEFTSRRLIKDLAPVDVIGYGMDAENIKVYGDACMSFDVYENDLDDLNRYLRMDYTVCNW